MKKLFAIGTLLVSSAAVFAAPAPYDRNFHNDYNDHARVEREDKTRVELRLRQKRIERERRERELRRLRYLHSLGNRW
jgi:hypothetical protein